MAKHKKKRKRLHLRRGFILLIVLLLLFGGFACHYRDAIRRRLFPQDPNANGETVLTEIISGNLQADTAELTSRGDILKVDYIQPGLDTYTLFTAIHAVSDGRNLSRTACGNGDFTTGLTANGFFVGRLSDRAIDLYADDATLRKTVKAPTDAPLGELIISENESYLLFNDLDAATICVSDIKTDAIVYSLPFDSKLSLCGTRGSRFYLLKGNKTLLTVDAAAGDCKETALPGTVCALTPDAYVTRSGKTCTVYTIDGKKCGTARLQSSEEILAAFSEKRLVTVTEEEDTFVTAYDYSGAHFSYSFRSKVLAAAMTDSGAVALAVAENYGETPEIFLLQPEGTLVSAATTTTTKATTAKATTTTVKTTTAAPATTVSRSTGTRAPTTVHTTVPVQLGGQKVLSDVPIIAQRPTFPTGCESVSAVIALQYAGVDISVADFVDKYLDKSSHFYNENGKRYGPDPYKVFVGSPRSTASYGCMAPVIENAVKKIVGSSMTVENKTGYTLPMLCKDYIDKGIPCVVWVSIGMLATYKSASWTLEDGSTYYFPANEHCMVLIGYSDTHYYFSDPYRGAHVKYSRSISEKRYEELGRQALVFTPLS